MVTGLPARMQRGLKLLKQLLGITDSDGYTSGIFPKRVIRLGEVENDYVVRFLETFEFPGRHEPHSCTKWWTVCLLTVGALARLQ